MDVIPKPIYTSCEYEWDTNVGVTNSQRVIRNSWVVLNSPANISQRKQSCNVKSTSNLHRIRIKGKYELSVGLIWTFFGGIPQHPQLKPVKET